MPYMQSKTITNNRDGLIETGETTGASTIFEKSQFLSALDGTWLMIEWFTYEDGQYSWYVTMQ